MTCPACLTCQHWQPRQAGDMARHGFAPCELRPPHTHRSKSASCGKYAAVADEVAQKRIAWFDNTKQLAQAAKGKA